MEIGYADFGVFSSSSAAIDGAGIKFREERCSINNPYRKRLGRVSARLWA